MLVVNLIRGNRMSILKQHIVAVEIHEEGSRIYTTNRIFDVTETYAYVTSCLT